MGCFVSCFRSNDEERKTRESVNELGSLSCNGQKEEMLSRPHPTSEQSTQEETPMEDCQLIKKITFQEINQLDQSPKSVQTWSTKKIQLVAPCEQENSPDQAIMRTTDVGNNSTSCQNTPGTGRYYSGTPAVTVSDLSKWLNGIPNTTTKYKEDQQVKWHATPFEERLDRILSDEKMPLQRKLISGRLIQLEE